MYTTRQNNTAAGNIRLFGNVRVLIVAALLTALSGAVGKVYVTLDKMSDKRGISVTLEDEGVPFDPLAHEDPDVTLSVDERGIGGLGIFLVRRTMDEMRYEYGDGRNKLTITKSF